MRRRENINLPEESTSTKMSSLLLLKCDAKLGLSFYSSENTNIKSFIPAMKNVLCTKGMLYMLRLCALNIQYIL